MTGALCGHRCDEDAMKRKSGVRESGKGKKSRKVKGSNKPGRITLNVYVAFESAIVYGKVSLRRGLNNIFFYGARRSPTVVWQTVPSVVVWVKVSFPFPAAGSSSSKLSSTHETEGSRTGCNTSSSARLADVPQFLEVALV